MSSDPFFESLVHATSPAPYNQLVVLSQKTINDAFASMWALAEPGSMMRSVQIQTRDGETINAQLLAPRVIINVVNQDFTMYFQWRFQSGSMTLYTSDEETDLTTKDFILNNWVIAFGTRLTHEDIPETDPSYDTYKDQMEVPPESQFSLVKLYLKCIESLEYYPEGSDFPGEDWSMESAATREHFQQLRLIWMKEMESARNTDVGVMLRTDQPLTVNATAPTFPPTSIDYCVYPWKDPVSQSNVSNGSDSNALCYLIMTNNATAPVPASLPYSGTWVDADNSETGRGAILIMGNKQFWDGWLLPLMQAMNMATQIQPMTPSMKPSTNGPEINGSFKPGTCTTYPDSFDTYYNFTRSGNGNTWTWAATPGFLATVNSLVVGNNNWTLEQSATANTSLTFTPGGDGGIFTLTGNNSAKFQCNSEGDWVTLSTMSFDTQYSITYTAQRVDSGGVQIQQSGDVNVIQSPVNVTLEGGVTWTPTLTEWGGQVQNQANSAFTWQLQAQQTALLNGLAGQHKLFLPVGGTYLCNLVTFNAAGDLLTNLHFNGALPPGQEQARTPVVPDAPPFQHPRPFKSKALREVRSQTMKPSRVKQNAKL